MIIDDLLLRCEEIFRIIFDSIDNKRKFLLTYLNQSSFNIYFRNKDYRRIIDEKFKVYQADLGVYLLLKILNKKNIKRIDATYLNEKILDEIIKNKTLVGFVGSSFSENFIREECVKRNINLISYQNGFFSEKDTHKIINEISTSSAQIILIGMGVPKQEYFAYELSKTVENKIIICVGNFFEFYFGSVKRAPDVFKRLGFEWLFRLITEPGRLWKRYLIGIPEFIYRSLKIKFIKKSF